MVSLSSALYLILAILCFIILIQSTSTCKAQPIQRFQNCCLSCIFESRGFLKYQHFFCSRRPRFSGFNEILGQYWNSKVSSNDSFHLFQLYQTTIGRGGDSVGQSVRLARTSRVRILAITDRICSLLRVTFLNQWTILERDENVIQTKQKGDQERNINAVITLLYWAIGQYP